MNYLTVPYWFVGYNVMLEILFSAVAFLVGAYALKIYKISGQRQSKLFGISFLMIAASYFIQSALNFASGYSMSQGCNMQSMSSMYYLNTLGIYSHMILFTTGLVTLAYMALRIKDPKAYFLFVAIAIGTLLISSNKLHFFYVISSILLIYLSFFYLKNYLQGRKKNALIVFIGFLFLLFAKIHFIFSIDHSIFYVAGHMLEFVAYVLILMNLITVLRKK
ncbi:MAG TPA: hypothetical protein VI564_09360 [Candidatus Nanoarchaeia archaeon]|nr:hypothetical protein [Candidatus Nanoarchaeia archaeon]